MSYRLIISPAKTMNVVEGPPYVLAQPRFLTQTRELMQVVQALSYGEAKTLWACSDKLAQLNFERFAQMDLAREQTAAVLAYEGIQYQYLAAPVLSEAALDHLAQHLRILSGFYGLLHPFDGVVPYRLEMQARLSVAGAKDLYGYWGPRLAEALAHETDTVVNLASVEYAKAVLPHADAVGLKVLTCLFGTVRDGKLVQRSTEAKSARGSFCRWCAEQGIERIDEFVNFAERGYALDEERSNEMTLVFTTPESGARHGVGLKGVLW